MTKPRMRFSLKESLHYDLPKFLEGYVKDMIFVFAALSDCEKEIKGERISRALAAAKARGVKLGGYRGGDLSNRNL